MRYLTKEWYELCQRTGLHFGMRVHRGAYELDEALFLRRYKRKEKEYIELQREMYNTDPRFLLEQNGHVFVPAEKFFSGNEISEDDKKVYQMPAEERERIEKLIAEYDVRPPFEELQHRIAFKDMQEWDYKHQEERLPKEIYEQIVDIRLFTLGYCTREILLQLKKQSAENTIEMDRVSKEYREAILAQDIPDEIRSRVQFHDCTVTELLTGEEVVIRFDTSGGFTNMNKLTLIAPEIIKREGEIVGSYWLYQELYRIDNGYELHVLFYGENMPELIVRCEDILAEEE
ncbi:MULTISPECIES: DUF4085 family protein [unclassified Paenibacillus]|uniref:DUF4085 family protein n=1 Tax=unclassified Paenibacillus TaxID=185978 RepID=UPI0009A5FE54|nr:MULTISPECIES: DUF4085 family protein [unclassified Paenibacillus]SLK13018.1 Protein of unknown function [Paenibacillus sp. RU5A]SOC72851.1 Protein of unknown function [Paenibacillus sp. RU26A]SOC75106.1 Protein of unknown function [Paenibacillus sp. RU5M]